MVDLRYIADGVEQPRHLEQAREDAIVRAGRWYQTQCERLGVTRADIEAAVLRGWCGDQIAELPASRAEDLAGPPPLDPEIAAGIERIKIAPVKPVVRHGRAPWRH